MYQVIKPHKSHYPNPITVNKGERLLVGEHYQENPNWMNWVYCRTLNGDMEGWVPEQFLAIEGKEGIVRKTYTAKELNVEIGDELVEVKELNGWLWVKKSSTAEEGWVPKDHLQILRDEREYINEH